MGEIRITLPFHPNLLLAIRTDDFTFPFVHSRLNCFDILLFVFKEAVTNPTCYPPFTSISNYFYHLHHPLENEYEKSTFERLFSKVLFSVYKCQSVSIFCISSKSVISKISSFFSGSESSNLNPANASRSPLTIACASKTFPLSTESNPKPF